MKLNNQKGIALVTTMFFVAILISLQAIFIVNVVNESKLARIEREQAKTFYAANGGAQAAVEQLDVLINSYLQTTISNSSPSGVINYAQSKVNSGDGIGWLVYAVRNNNIAVLTQNGEEATFTSTATLNENVYTYNIIFSEKSDPSSSGTDAWDFPYNFRIESAGTSASTTSNVVLSGDFTVQVQRDNFAKYALFTSRQQTSSGSNVWFTDRTNFAGPVHTNDRFNFAFNPSGTFEEVLAQDEATARFYNGGSSVLIDADSNGSIDVPTFHGGFDRDVDEVSFTSATVEQDMIDQAQGGGGNFNSNGIYVPANGNNLAGGIYVKGDSLVAMSVSNNKAVYTITQGATTKVITVDHVANQTTVLNSSNNSTITYTGKPDGTDDAGTLIYVDGAITSLAGIVQGDTEVTVASHNDISITNNVKYTNYSSGSGTPGTVGYVPPSADSYNNLLGIVTWAGDVRVAPTAPNNVEIHGSIMAQSGVFTVDNYTDTGVGSRGTATLLGGAITDDYGAFGQFNSATAQQVSGYGRNFVYDQRMQQGKAPPYFPSLDMFIAFTNDITDKIVWQEGSE